MVNYDLHTHTKFSDGAHELTMTVKFAEAMGLDAVAITDHFTPQISLWEEEGLFDKYLEEIRRASDWAETLVLAGVEATVLNLKGKISMSEELFSRLDVVLVDFGGHTKGIFRNTPSSKDKLIANVTKCLVSVTENPLFHVLAHPFNLGRLNNPIEPAEIPSPCIEEIASAMRENNKIFEVMNCMFWWFPNMPVRKFTEQYLEIVQVFVDEGVLFSVGSDDHRTGVGNITWSKRILQMAEVPTEQIVNPREYFEKKCND